MNPSAIRRTRKEDQASVGVLWMHLLREHAALDARFGVADDALERWTNDFPHWLHDEQHRVFVAEQEGALVGFVTAEVWTPPPVYAASQEVYINELYVVPEVREKGVGQALIEAVRDWAQGLRVDRLRIGVLAANADGRAFWTQQQAQPLSLTLTIELDKAVIPTDEVRKGRLGF